ncbi:MAG TPA: AAA family ATPase [Candidatus Dormibacteraeota bacterium]|nr:AAA family ATPase [Candidatus Dormibacteraeota bacterium]
MLLGRQSEIAAVGRALATARAGESSALLLRGEPGIGKTTLLGHAVRSAGPMRVLFARGVPFESDVPFAGLHALLLPALGSIDRLTAVQAGGLRGALGLGERVGADRLVVGAATLSLISVFAEEGPVLIAVDDGHLLDRASAEAIAFAARRMFADPVAILVAIREGEPSPLLEAGLPELGLGGLDREAGLALLERGAGGPIPAETADRVLRATGGNPLALVELAEEALTLPVTAAHVPLPIATTVERAYLRRALALSAGARLALLLLSASPASGWELIERAGAELGVARPALDEAAAAEGLVRLRRGRIEFRHPLARAALYHAAGAEQRRAAHRALHRVMTDPDQADVRAWQLAAAADGPDAEAAEALAEAAVRARARSAHASAASAMEESARLTEDDGPCAARLREAAENLWLAGRPERVMELLETARGITEDPVLRLSIDSLRGHVAMRRGAVEDGYHILWEAAVGAVGIDRRASIRLLADAAIGSYGAGRPAQMLRATERALELLRPDDPPHLAILARVGFGISAVMAGRGDEGPRALRAALPLMREVEAHGSDPLMLMCAGFVPIFLREASAGRELLEWAQTMARDRAPTAVLPTLLFMLGRDAATTDRWTLARAHYEEAARLARETTDSAEVAAALAGLAWLDARQGRVEECRAHAGAALDLAGRLGMHFYRAWALIALGEVELGSGTPGAAAARFEACQRLLGEIGMEDPDLSPAPDLVEAYARGGDAEAARRTAEGLQAAAISKGQPFALARAVRSLAVVAPDGEYAPLFETALGHHGQTPDTFERARTQLAYGERLRRSRRRGVARVQLRAALEAFDRLGAEPWAERARAELQATGETARRRDDSTRLQLTPQELHIALSLAGGRTTRETAARLYLSPKTVEYHLRNIYGKLGVRSRDELRTALGEPGGEDDSGS